MEIAKTILQQLGGNKFIVMTGAKNFGILKDHNGIAFSIPLHRKVKGIRIKLNSLDLYDMEFLNRNFQVIKEYKDIYNDQLQDLFTRETGLYTHL